MDRLRLCYLWPSLPQLTREDNSYSFSKPSTELTAHFLMTGKEPHFLKFYKFSLSLRQSIIAPESSSRGTQLLNEEQQKLPLCEGIELFGTCNNPSTISTCGIGHRHAFNEADFDCKTNAPSHGEVKIFKTPKKTPKNTRKLRLNLFKTVYSRLNLKSQTVPVPVNIKGS